MYEQVKTEVKRPIQNIDFKIKREDIVTTFGLLVHCK